ncbi:hypothetical protein G9A89_005699 [Geosiphon pyriformis]|nr:hypothetical protein G9A89_005699 [Geosiphon pyriformis]
MFRKLPLLSRNFAIRHDALGSFRFQYHPKMTSSLGPMLGNPKFSSHDAKTNTLHDESLNQNSKESVISSFQRTLLGLSSAITGFIDPTRQDMIATLGETTGQIFLARLRDMMLLDTTGRRILREQPVVNSSTINIVKLRQYPQGTFGKKYVEFLDSYKVSPDSRVKVQYIQDQELAYVMQRFRESHDFFHALTNLSITVESEIALKWFELAQTGLPVSLLSSLVGPLRLTSAERARLFSVYVPWAIQCGSASKFLMNVYFEEWFEKDLESMRRELGIYLPDLGA